MEKLSGESILMPAGEFVQSEVRQRRNLEEILGKINQILELDENQRG